MGDATGGHRRAVWSLLWRGTGDAPGSSWEGEGLQPRFATASGGRRGRALAVMAMGLLLGGGALLLAAREQADGDELGATDPQTRSERTSAHEEPVSSPATGRVLVGGVRGAGR